MAGKHKPIKEKMAETRGLTPDEKKNGWTRPKLEQYLKERDVAANEKMGLGGHDRYVPPDLQVDFDPHDW